LSVLVRITGGGVDKKSEKACRKRLRKALRKAYRAWDREREISASFGQSHINDIDAIFSREIARLERKVNGSKDD
jgi:hypothetical protein